MVGIQSQWEARGDPPERTAEKAVFFIGLASPLDKGRQLLYSRYVRKALSLGRVHHQSSNITTMKHTTFTKKTVYFASRTTPGLKYKTERHKNGTATCFCPGFVYRRTCCHVMRVGEYA